MPSNCISDVDTRPEILEPRLDRIPVILTMLPRWVCWHLAFVNGRFTKVPKQPNGRNASVTDPKTWSPFDVVCAAYQSSGESFDGVGIVLGEPFEHEGKLVYLVGLDFDHCVEQGKPQSFVKEIRAELNTYTEFSPSGTGIRMFLLHDKPIKARKTRVDGNSREVYSDARYLTVTGHGKGEVRYVP